jgi:Ca2+-binding EF-hand superfamily protein
MVRVVLSGSGKIDVDEFRSAIRSIGFDYNETQVTALFGR